MHTGQVFEDDSTQMVRMPVGARFAHDVKKVLVRKVGHERILTPVNHIWDNFFMAQEGVSDDFLPERANQHQCDREEF
ncbi:MAG: type II toxin-antitoxin system VapB family antitoxin [Desulfomicrobium sp.]|nr:type II toxin-antitoxin system VapB family antitoxin [Desulfomicrobium sp.]